MIGTTSILSTTKENLDKTPITGISELAGQPEFIALVSKVFRLTTTFTKDGANDISEFVKPGNPYAYSASEGTPSIPAHNPKVVMYKTKSE